LEETAPRPGSHREADQGQIHRRRPFGTAFIIIHIIIVIIISFIY
jgi:hypothetical protein